MTPYQISAHLNTRSACKLSCSELMTTFRCGVSVACVLILATACALFNINFHTYMSTEMWWLSSASSFSLCVLSAFSSVLQFRTVLSFCVCLNAMPRCLSVVMTLYVP